MDAKDSLSPLEQLAAELHESLARQLVERVKTGQATAAELNVARQFLKDNGIDSVVKDIGPMANLAKILPFTDPAGPAWAERKASEG